MLQVELPQIGPYSPVRPLGEGSTTYTHLYRHEQRKKYAVLKVTRTPLGTLAEKEAFLARAKLLKKLKHRNIAEVQDFGMLQSGAPAEDYGYLVVQYTQSSTIRERFVEDEHYQPDEVKRVLSPLADALHYAHVMNVTHGNLHPGNILQGEMKDFLLTDFSLALPTQETFDRPEILLYRAPEHLKGAATPASDQYALAVLVYEWLCGRRPYQASSREELLYQQEHESLPLPSGLNPRISPLIEATLLRALAFNPGERFPQTLTFADTYLRALMGFALPAEVNSLPTTIRGKENGTAQLTRVQQAQSSILTPNESPAGKKSTTETSEAASSLHSAHDGATSNVPDPSRPATQTHVNQIPQEMTTKPGKKKPKQPQQYAETAAKQVQKPVKLAQQPATVPVQQIIEQPVKQSPQPATQPERQVQQSAEMPASDKQAKSAQTERQDRPLAAYTPSDLQRRVEADLRQGGALSQCLSGYEERPAQIEMAALVSRAITESTPAVIEAATGTGKALDVETPIPTPTGWKRMGDLTAGDMVFDEQGQPTRVTAAFAVMYNRPCYEVAFSDGSSLIADAEHEWASYTAADRTRLAHPQPGTSTTKDFMTLDKLVALDQLTSSRNNDRMRSANKAVTPAKGPHWSVYQATRTPGATSTDTEGIPRPSQPASLAVVQDCLAEQRRDRNSYTLVTTAQMAATLTVHASPRANHAIAVAGALVLPGADLPIAPYLLGAWLGADTGHSSILRQAIVSVSRNTSRRHSSLLGTSRPLLLSQPGWHRFQDRLSTLGLLQNRHIPATYLRASRQQRQALLAGLLDSTGRVRLHGAIEFTTTSAQIAQDVYELICSLGLQPLLRQGSTRSNRRKRSPRWTIIFTAERQIFRRERKAVAWKERPRHYPSELNGFRYVVAVREVPSRPVRCIQVEAPSHLYLAGPSMIPTHNSLAYLISVVRSGKVAIISTANKALQEQLFYKDIPFVQKYIRHFDAALVKGMSNYICLDRMEQERVGIQHYVKNRDFLRLLERVEKSDEKFAGDFETLGFTLPADIRSKVSADRDQCTWSKCSYFSECYVRKMKARAGQASVIVVNHTLLLLDALMEGYLLPERDVIVIDEAHHLEEEATRAFTVTISQVQVSTLLAQRMLKDHTPPALQEESKETMNLAWERLYQVADPGYKGRANLKEPLQEGLGLASILARLADALRTGRPRDLPEREEQLYDKLITRAQNLADDVRIVFSVNQPGKYVYYIERANTAGRRGFQQLEVSAAPMEVTSWLKEQLFDKANVICTSATLATIGPDPARPEVKGPNFAYFRRRVGLDANDYPEVQERILPLTFDYQSNALLYLPRHLPEPAYGTGPIVQEYTRAIAREMINLVEASRGRAFLLFSSKRMLDEVFEIFQRELPPHLKLPLLRQGDMTRIELMRNFRDREGAVLFGLKSFWEGVDIAGETLSLVVIDKLPFDPPDDPVHEARVAQMKASGENWFGIYVLPQAVLRLKQGLGRLLRTHDDRGVMAILDTRLYTKGYGKQIVLALPPARRTANLSSVTQFFKDDEEEAPF